MPTVDHRRVPGADGQEVSVFVLQLDLDDNRINPSMVVAINAALDAAEQADGPGALVLTGSGKFFSNGLDLAWMSANAEASQPFLDGVHALLARLLTAPVHTVAAVNGHAFAGGAMLALAMDAAVMRADRGYVCLPEVDLGMVFTPGMTALLQARLRPEVAHEAMLTARRYPAEAALAAGMVSEVVPEDSVLPRAVELAAAQAGRSGQVLAGIKRLMYAGAVAALTQSGQALRG